MSRTVKWTIGLVIALLVGLTLCAGPSPVAPTPPNVDSLRAANASLAHQNGKLKVDLAQHKIDLLDLRDSVGRATAKSDSATTVIRNDRAKLPAANAVSQDRLRESYAAGLAQLDRALAELGRKDQIIRQQRLAQVMSDKIESDLRQLLANSEEQYKNEQDISTKWKQRSDSLFNELNKRRCGKKCGIVIGVVSTVGAAIVAKKVGDALDANKPD